MKTRYTLSVFSFAALVLLSACKPAADSAQSALAGQIQTESAGHIKLASFTKTDGQTIQVNGVEGYRLSYTAEIQFDANGTWSSGNYPGRLSFNFTPGVAPARGGIGGLMGAITRDKEAHQGQLVKITGVLIGTKSENGWQFQQEQGSIGD